MKIKLVLILFLVGGTLGGSYYYYHQNYVETLTLNEIVGHTDNPLVNIAINLADFDTGLTRHDIKQLSENKGYWLQRINEVEAISDPNTKEHASYMLLDEMMEDPVLKKILSGVLNLGINVAFSLLGTVL